MIRIDNDLKDVMKSVLDYALQPIQNELQQLNQRIGNIETELKDFRTETKASVQIIQSGQQGTRKRNDTTLQGNPTQLGPS